MLDPVNHRRCPVPRASGAAPRASGGRIAAVRRFNRFYTQLLGLLDESLHDSSFSLTEVRVLYELAHREGPTARDLSRALRLDEASLSRILRRFEQRGLVRRTASAADGRRSHLELTKKGRAAYEPLD